MPSRKRQLTKTRFKDYSNGLSGFRKQDTTRCKVLPDHLVHFGEIFCFVGATRRDRTGDLLITNQKQPCIALYHPVSCLLPTLVLTGARLYRGVSSRSQTTSTARSTARTKRSQIIDARSNDQKAD